MLPSTFSFWSAINMWHRAFLSNKATSTPPKVSLYSILCFGLALFSSRLQGDHSKEIVANSQLVFHHCSFLYLFSDLFPLKRDHKGIIICLQKLSLLIGKAPTVHSQNCWLFILWVWLIFSGCQQFSQHTKALPTIQRAQGQSFLGHWQRHVVLLLIRFFYVFQNSHQNEEFLCLLDSGSCVSKF